MSRFHATVLAVGIVLCGPSGGMPGPRGATAAEATAAAAGGATIPWAPRDERKAADAKFTAGPKVERTAEGAKVSFAASAATDVEVAVLDAKGSVIRHLAAGLLGPQAPAPLAKSSLSQEIVWDGKDDRGEKAAGAARVRVRLGMKAGLDRHLGWDGLTFEGDIVAVAVGAEGEVYVVDCENSWGRSSIRVLSKEGKYLRTILPFPAGTPLERRKDFGTHRMPDGTEVPFVFNAQDGSTQPLVSGLRYQDIVMHPDGHLVMTSANGTMSNHGPAQHLIAIHPQGGAPEKTGYVGPMVRPANGFMGGSGNRGANVYNGLALSPDGKRFYQCKFSDNWAYKKQPQCVFRLEWGDKGTGEPFLGALEAGADDAHFNHPLGLATDAAGNIYVCDNGNDRVMIFSPEARLLHKIAVPSPLQVRVHPASGEIYVLSREFGSPAKIKGNAKILKFSPAAKGAPGKVAEFDTGAKVTCMALDHTASPARLYLAKPRGWKKSDALLTIEDKGASFEPGQQVSNADGLSYPLFVAADPERGRAYVRNFIGGMVSLDLATGKNAPLGIPADEVALDAQGNLYACSGWAWMIRRYSPEKKDLALKDGNQDGKNKGALGPWNLDPAIPEKQADMVARSKGFNQGGRGYAFGPDGNLYVIKMPQYTHGQVDVYSPEGKLIREKLIDSLPYSSGGIGVDAAGNVYIGVNMRPPEGTELFPKGFGTAPTGTWVWYRDKREPPWSYCYYNTYLFYYGGVMKFPPKGAKFYHAWDTRQESKKGELPAGLPQYRSGYLRYKMAVDGGEWIFNGCSPVPTSGENWGDPSCTCWNMRLDVDPYGRVFAPDCFRFAMNVTDSAGNVIARIGRHGNADDVGKGADIRFAWPCYLDQIEDAVYVSDVNSNRITVVTLTYAAEASAGL